MPSFAGGNGQFTPSTTNDNWTLDSGATAAGPIRVTQISWGGSNTSSNGYRTRWTRPSTNGTGAGTPIALAYNNPSYTTAVSALNSTYATTQPTLTADPGNNLYATDWNNQGGSGILVLPLAQAWFLIASGGANKSQLSCRNTKGVDASLSSYNVAWEED
jgi:hypothetical protein